MSQLKVDLPPEVSVDEARLLLMAKLFEVGRLSLGQAAKLAGCSRERFIELLERLGMAGFSYLVEDLKPQFDR